MSCLPPYGYVPEFTPSNSSCTADVSNERRARVIIQTSGDMGTSLFFRSRDLSSSTNQLSVELTADRVLIVRDGEDIRHTHPISPGAGAVQIVRSVLAGSEIEMPILGIDVHDSRASEGDGDSITDSGLTQFNRTYLVGGSGATSQINTIRCGPSRTISIVATTEDVFGNVVSPPASRRIRQWDGADWISYCNTTQGSCPINGACID